MRAWRHSLAAYDRATGTYVFVAFLLLAIVPWATGCQPERSATQREFSRLDRALSRLQKADNAHKAEPLRDLSETSCQRLCDFRQMCVEAYRLHLEAIERMSRVRAALSAEPGQEAPGTATSFRELNDATALLERALPLTQGCAARQGELRRAWGH